MVCAFALVSCSPAPPASTAATVGVPPGGNPIPEEPYPPEPDSPTESPPETREADAGVRPVFGCGSFPTVKSQDSCQNSVDCAPATPCHATSCVAAANATALPAGAQCTMKLVCQSVDVGRCDCVDGVCALVSR
jgi:hypothetical protein